VYAGLSLLLFCLLFPSRLRRAFYFATCQCPFFSLLFLSFLFFIFQALLSGIFFPFPQLSVVPGCAPCLHSRRRFAFSSSHVFLLAAVAASLSSPFLFLRAMTLISSLVVCGQSELHYFANFRMCDPCELRSKLGSPAAGPQARRSRGSSKLKSVFNMLYD